MAFWRILVLTVFCSRRRSSIRPAIASVARAAQHGVDGLGDQAEPFVAPDEAGPQQHEVVVVR